MLVFLEEDVLLEAPLAGLERLAAWLGITQPPLRPQDERERRGTLVIAIIREERRLASCRRSERWNASRARRPRPV
jgi:hypothetical protein